MHYHSRSQWSLNPYFLLPCFLLLVGAELSFDPLDLLAPASTTGVLGPVATAGVGDIGGGFMTGSGSTGLFVVH